MFAGIDLGGTKIAVVRGKGKVIEKKISFPSSAPETALPLIFDALDGFLPFDAIGVSCGNPLDPVSGVILSPPNMDRWDDIPIVKMLEERYSCPAALCNDANACALAEHRYGAGRGTTNMVFLTFGTGMGAGLILNGELYSGACNNAGEVGHIRLAEDGPMGYGKKGSFEGFCSGGGIARLAQGYAKDAIKHGKTVSFCEKDGNFESISAKSVSQAARRGEPDALAVCSEVGKKLGAALAMIVDVLNPERVVLGSIYVRSGELFREHAYAVLEREALSDSLAACSFVPAELGEMLGDTAALTVAEIALRKKKQ